MGTEVCRAVDADPDLDLVAAVDPARAGTTLEVRSRALVVGAGADTLAEAGAEVAVDFTVATAAEANLAFCAGHGIHAVAGTTGVPPERLEALGARFEAAGLGLVVAANFAIGAVLLMRMCELAAPHMDGVEIIELHHDAKRDAPSGTALATARRIEAARGRAWGPDPTTETVVAGVRGGLGPGGVHVHAVRLPGLVAHQEVIFGAAGQSLTIRHDAYDRASFMPGVLLAVRQVAERPGLTVGLEPLLGI